MTNWLIRLCNSDPQIDSRPFDALAYAQRGKPEAAMLNIQRSQICQLYGWVCEHVGDLTHRMSESINWSQGGYEFVKEKVDKTLRTLLNSPEYNDTMLFEEDVQRQIESNWNYHQENPKKYYDHPTPEAALSKLRELGKLYADAHRALPTFNEVQKLAQNAAVAVGEFDFAIARLYLFKLSNYLEEGPESWAIRAMENSKAPQSIDLETAYNDMQETTEIENSILQPWTQKRDQTK